MLTPETVKLMNAGREALGYRLSCDRIIQGREREQDRKYLRDLGESLASSNEHFDDGLYAILEKALKDKININELPQILKQASPDSFLKYLGILKNIFQEAHEIADEEIAFGHS